MQDEQDVFLTPEEAANYLSITVSTVYRYINLSENPLPSYKVSLKNIRIKKSELVSWIESYFRKPEDSKQ